MRTCGADLDVFQSQRLGCRARPTQMHTRLTLPLSGLMALALLLPGCTRPPEAECKKFADHVKELTLAELAPRGDAAVKAGGDAFEKDGREALMKTCAEQGSQREIDCVLKAKTLNELNECS